MSGKKTCERNGPPSPRKRGFEKWKNKFAKKIASLCGLPNNQFTTYQVPYQLKK
jgi:hypothetical protein